MECCVDITDILKKECIACVDKLPHGLDLSQIVFISKCKLLRHLLQNNNSINPSFYIKYIAYSDSKSNKIIKILIEYGATFKSYDIYNIIKSAPYIQKEIFYMLEQKDTNRLDLSYISNRMGLAMSPMIYAVEYGKIVFLEYLLEKKYPIDVCDDSGNTPLMLAVKKGNIKMVKMLLENGADCGKVDTSGNPILYYAVQSGKLEIVKLCGLGDINKRNIYGETPLHEAIFTTSSENSFDIFKYLMEGTTSLLENNEGNTPLDYADEYEQYDKIQVMMDKLFTPIIIII